MACRIDDSGEYGFEVLWRKGTPCVFTLCKLFFIEFEGILKFVQETLILRVDKADNEAIW